MYRVYLRTADQQVPPESKTVTGSQEVAAAAFAELISRTDLDGQKLAAALTHNNRQLAFHRFDHPPSTSQHWRGRMDEIEWPA